MNEKKVEESPTEKGGASGEEQNVPRPPVKPQSAKPPPPTPPSTYANDKLRLESISETTEKGKSKGKGKEQGKQKGRTESKGLGKWRGQSIKGKKGTPAAQTDDTKSVYKSYTTQEKNWGPLKQKEAWEKECYQNDDRWEWCTPDHKEVWISRKKESPAGEDDPMASASGSPTLGSEKKAKCHAK